MAVMTVILIIAIMLTLLGFMVESQHLLIRKVGNQIISEQAYQVAMGSEIKAIRVLEKDAQLPDVIDHLEEDWNKLYVEEGEEIDQGRANLTIMVIDLQGKFNLNNIAQQDASSVESGRKQFHRLLQMLDVQDANILADTLRDWVDQGDLHQLNGAETPEYNGLEPAYYASDQMLTSVGELRYVKGFTSEVINAIAEYVTVIPADNIKINLNTCGAMQLRLLGKTPGSINETTANDFVENRPPDGYANVTDALNALQNYGVPQTAFVAKYQEMVTTKSDYFEVQSEAKYGDLIYRMRSKLYRSGQEPIKVISRQHQLL